MLFGQAMVNPTRTITRAAEQCISNAPEQIRRDKERLDELTRIIENTSFLSAEMDREMSEIDCRSYLIPWRDNDGLPYFSIIEYDVMN